MRLTLDHLRTELETDPAGLGYRRPDGSWLSASEIGHLLAEYRLGPLCDGGPVDLKFVGRLVYGPDWVCEMLRRGETTIHDVRVLAGQSKIAPGVLAAAEVIHAGQERRRIETYLTSHPPAPEFPADEWEPSSPTDVPADPYREV